LACRGEGRLGAWQRSLTDHVWSRALSIPARDVPLDGDNECVQAFVRFFVRDGQRVHTLGQRVHTLSQPVHAFDEVNLGLRKAPYEVGQLADFPVMAF
jgi:hypothetical protein